MSQSTQPPGSVLHAPVDIAGQASRSVQGLRLLGVPADLYAPPHPYGYDPADFAPSRNRIRLARTIVGLARAHDTFHFHFGETFHRRLRLTDARALRAAGRRVVVEFHGSDVRMPSIEAARNPYYVRLPGEDDATAERLMADWAVITDGHVICCDPSMIPFVERHFEHIHLVGKRVEVRRYEPIPPQCARRRLVVAHAPSDPVAKGTAFVRAAIGRLGGRVEYVELTGVAHAELTRALRGADVVVDHLCVASYGVLGIEAMSMAKPVICSMLPDYFRNLPPDCPVICANPGTIESVLAEWSDRRPELRDIGLASRAYAENNHDVAVVARRLIEIYAQLPTR